MIHKDSRTAEWIAEVASKYKVSDAALVEKAIRAFSWSSRTANAREWCATTLYRTIITTSMRRISVSSGRRHDRFTVLATQ